MFVPCRPSSKGYSLRLFCKCLISFERDRNSIIRTIVRNATYSRFKLGRVLKCCRYQILHNLLIFAMTFTLWKFQDFSVTQILREINFRECEICKTKLPVFLQFRGYELFKIEFQPSKNARIHKISKV